VGRLGGEKIYHFNTLKLLFMKLNYTQLTFITFILASILLSCNFSTSNSDLQDSTNTVPNVNSDTTSSVKNITDTIPKDTITNFANANFTHQDSAKYYVYTSMVDTVIMSGDDLYNAYEKIQKDEYIYIYFYFSNHAQKPFFVIAAGLNDEHKPDRIHLIIGKPSKPLTSNTPVGSQRYWVRPSILYEDDLKAFLESLKKNDSVDLASDGNKYQIIISPSVEKDNSNSNFTQYIGLTLSVKEKSVNGQKPSTMSIKTTQKTNPCPRCTE
jgi:hypothetical protein